MGYIKFKKDASAAGGSADLLPAENILHVGVPTATAVVIMYAATDGTALIEATVGYDTQTDFSTIRDAINNAIELANGTSGPAIVVDMVSINSVTVS